MNATIVWMLIGTLGGQVFCGVFGCSFDCCTELFCDGMIIREYHILSS
jgi:hypothetical protein